MVAAFRAHEQAGRVLATICAATLILAENKLPATPGTHVTSHPSVADAIKAAGHHAYSEERVCVDGNVITSRAPGTTFEFALAIVERLCGVDEKDKIMPPMMCRL